MEFSGNINVSAYPLNTLHPTLPQVNENHASAVDAYRFIFVHRPRTVRLKHASILKSMIRRASYACRYEMLSLQVSHAYAFLLTIKSDQQYCNTIMFTMCLGARTFSRWTNIAISKILCIYVQQYIRIISLIDIFT